MSSKSKAKSSLKGKLIFHDEVKKYSNDGKLKSTEEMSVTHAEDGYSAKYFVKKNDKSTKIMVRAPGTGGEYTLVVMENGDKKESKHSKTELLAYLKKNPALGFMIDYISKTKSLARARRAKKGSKKVARKQSKSKSKSKRSKAKRSKSKSKSRSRSRSRKRSMKRSVAGRSGTKRKGAKKTRSKRRRGSKTGSKRKTVAKKRSKSKRR